MRDIAQPAMGVPPDRPQSGGAGKRINGHAGRPGDREGAAVELLAATSALLDEVNALASRHQDELQRSVERCLNEQVRLLQACEVSEAPPRAAQLAQPAQQRRSVSEGGRRPRRSVADVDSPDSCGRRQRRSKTEGDVLGNNSGNDGEPLESQNSLRTPPSSEQALYHKVHSELQRAETQNTKKRVSDCLFEEERRRVEAEMSWLQRVTASRIFEWASGLLIVLNAILLGLETHWEAESAWGAKLNGTPPMPATGEESLAIVTALFCIVFAIELGLRWAADGFFGFFRTTDVGWNIFDIIIVSVGVVDQIFSLFNVRLSTNVSVLRVLRVVRIVRCAKIIRVMRFFRELRIMVYSILGSFKSLLWVMMILALIFYVSGITLTMGIATHLQNDPRMPVGELADLHLYFGTLRRSMISLYMAMSGGNDWSVYYDALESLPLYQTFFIFFITFNVFAVVNIVTGVFVDAALQSNSDKEVIVNEELEGKKEYLVEIGKLFCEMDADNTGSITEAEFEERLADERVVAYFRALELDVTNARVLFRLLDYNQSGTIDKSEFLHGCYRLQGRATAIDVAINELELRFMREAILRINRDMSSLASRMESKEPTADGSSRTTSPTAEAPTPVASSARASSGGCGPEPPPFGPPPASELAFLAGAAADPVPAGLLPLQVPGAEEARVTKAPPRPRARMRHAAMSPLRAAGKPANARIEHTVVIGRLLPNHPGGA